MKFDEKKLEQEWITQKQPDRNWSSDIRDLFQITEYKVDLKEEFLDEYDDICYSLKRRNYDRLKE